MLFQIGEKVRDSRRDSRLIGVAEVIARERTKINGEWTYVYLVTDSANLTHSREHWELRSADK